MIIETLLVSGIGALISTIGKPRPIYGLTVGWWKGAFTPDDAAIGISRMIDSDFNCEWWAFGKKDYGRSRYYYSLPFRSEHLKTTISLHYDYDDDLERDKCSLILEDKNGDIIKFPISAYDDFVLVRAVERWRKRKKELDKMRELRKSEDIINERVTKGYIDQVEMIEKRILGKDDADTANELRASLTPPEKPKENVGYVTITNTGSGSVSGSGGVRKSGRAKKRAGAIPTPGEDRRAASN